MRKCFTSLIGLTVIAAGGLLLAGSAPAQQVESPQIITTPRGTIIVPNSSVVRPQDQGKRAHTNHLIFVPAKHGIPTPPTPETPGSIACIYQLPPYTTSDLAAGCRISDAADPTTGGSGVIAIVDAYHYPTAANDFDVFSTKFGLPLSDDSSCGDGNNQVCFKQVSATDTTPSVNCGWSQEAALDIEWAHAMAPHAQIVLVEANSSSLSDLFSAVGVATSEVRCGDTTCSSGTGTGEVSMSWGAAEFSNETMYDGTFSNTGVVYLAASGDTGGKTSYPAVSPNVMGCGGTSILRDANGAFTGESAWSDSGGGLSPYEDRPGYQDVISSIVGSQRGNPDWALDADPNTGVAVYDSTRCHGLSGWMIFGGTSVSVQALAGIVNSADQFKSDTPTELSDIYDCYDNGSCYEGAFRDITTGSAGHGRNAVHAQSGWDFITGVGTPVTLSSK